MNSNDLTPSEVVFLFANHFRDDVRGHDSSTERALIGEGRVNSERLAVAAIRAAIVANLRLGIISLSWTSTRAEIDGLMDQINMVGGLGAKAIGTLTHLPVVQSKMEEMRPQLQSTGALMPWPAQTVESLIACFSSSAPVGVFHHIEQQLGMGKTASGSGVLGAVKQGLLKRGLLQKYPRGFGLLSPGYELPDAVRLQARTRLLAVEGELSQTRIVDPQTWSRLGDAITLALRSGMI
jgi:hypothetical protein